MHLLNKLCSNNEPSGNAALFVWVTTKRFPVPATLLEKPKLPSLVSIFILIADSCEYNVNDFSLAYLIMYSVDSSATAILNCCSACTLHRDHIDIRFLWGLDSIHVYSTVQLCLIKKMKLISKLVSFSVLLGLANRETWNHGPVRGVVELRRAISVNHAAA